MARACGQGRGRGRKRQRSVSIPDARPPWRWPPSGGEAGFLDNVIEIPPRQIGQILSISHPATGELAEIATRLRTSFWRSLPRMLHYISGLEILLILRFLEHEVLWESVG